MSGTLPTNWFETEFAGIGRIRWAASLEQAVDDRNQLSAYEIWVTPQGHQVGRHWILGRPEIDMTPMLHAQIAELEQQATGLEIQCQDWEQQRPADRQTELKSQIQAATTAQADAQRQIDRWAAQIDLIDQRHSDYQQALARYESDLLGVDQELEEAHAELEDTADAEHHAAQELAQLPEPTDIDELERDWNEARDHLETIQANRSQETLNQQTSQARLEALADNLARARDELNDAQEGLADLEDQMAELVEPDDIQAELDDALRRRLAAESALGHQRAELASLDAALREMEHQRLVDEQALNDVRHRLSDVRAGLSEKRALQIAQRDQLHREGFEPQVVALSLGAATEADLQSKLDKLEAQRARLGAVNLAAMEELEQAQERQAYYQAQREDLESALATLEAAIKKIDRETRTLFKATFDRLNAGLQALFPKVFGGGRGLVRIDR